MKYIRSTTLGCKDIYAPIALSIIFAGNKIKISHYDIIKYQPV